MSDAVASLRQQRALRIKQLNDDTKHLKELPVYRDVSEFLQAHLRIAFDEGLIPDSDPQIVNLMLFGILRHILIEERATQFTDDVARLCIKQLLDYLPDLGWVVFSCYHSGVVVVGVRAVERCFVNCSSGS